MLKKSIVVITLFTQSLVASSNLKITTQEEELSPISVHSANSPITPVCSPTTAANPPSTPQYSPITPGALYTPSMKKIKDLEKEAVEHWQVAHKAFISAQRAYENINLKKKGDLELSIGIIKQALVVAELAEDMANDVEKEAVTPNARRAVANATKAVSKIRDLLEKAQAIEDKVNKQKAQSPNKK